MAFSPPRPCPLAPSKSTANFPRAERSYRRRPVPATPVKRCWIGPAHVHRIRSRGIRRPSRVVLKPARELRPLSEPIDLARGDRFRSEFATVRGDRPMRVGMPCAGARRRGRPQCVGLPHIARPSNWIGCRRSIVVPSEQIPRAMAGSVGHDAVRARAAPDVRRVASRHPLRGACPARLLDADDACLVSVAMDRIV